MSAELHLFAYDALTDEQEAALGLDGSTPLERIENRSDVSVSEKQAMLDDLDSVAIGSTRSAFADEFPNVLGSRVQTVDDAVIRRVKTHAEETTPVDVEEPYTSPDVEAILQFLRQHEGQRVFINAR